MFFWNSLAFLMIQRMLAIWSLVPLPFLNPAWTSGSSQFTYYWSLTWRILSITLLACEMSADCEVQSLKALYKVWGFPGGANGKESTCQCRRCWDTGLIPGSGRSPGGGHGNPLQYSCLENPMDWVAWQATVHGVAKSQTWLKLLSMHM